VIVEIYYTGKFFCAHAPELPGCISTSDNLGDMKKSIKEAIEFHLQSSAEPYHRDKPTATLALCSWCP